MKHERSNEMKTLNSNWRSYEVCLGEYSDGKKVAVLKTTFENYRGRETKTEMEFDKDEIEEIIDCLQEVANNL